MIGGTALKDWDEFDVQEKLDKKTSWGTPSSPIFKGELKGEETFLLLRHGRGHDIPPHRINHRANIHALQEEVEEIVGICSAGALNENIDVPSISIPKDYVNLWNPITFYNQKIKHVTPGLSEELREDLINAAEKSDQEKISQDTVYVQTHGPRLETEAEVDILKNYGDLVGMTMAHEATLSKEAAIDYATVTTIDNYGNGIREELDYEEIVDTAQDNWQNVKSILVRFLKER